MMPRWHRLPCRLAVLLAAALLSLPLVAADLLWTCLGADASREATVQWLAEAEPGDAFLEFGAVGTAMARIPAKFAPGPLGGWLASVPLRDLAPGTAYAYRPAGGGEETEGRFATAPAGPADFTFAVIGDVQGKGASDRWRQAATWLAGRQPAFWIPVGDLVDFGHDHAQWQHFFADGTPLFRTAPVMPVVGNHDTYADGARADGKRFVPRYPEPFFAFFPPSRDPSGTIPEGAYAWSYGDALFAAFNAYPVPPDGDPLASAPPQYERTRREAQMRWLDTRLGTAPVAWRFLALHPPVYSSGPHGISGDRPFERSVAELCDRHGIAAVFAGHTHAFEITRRLHGGAVAADDAPGTIYCNTAGINYSAIAKGSWYTDARQEQERMPLVMIVQVTQEAIVIETWDWQQDRRHHARRIPRFPAGTDAEHRGTP
jgi:hypothetical protein